MIRLYLWFCRVLFVARGPWVRWAPGLPCALVFKGDEACWTSSDALRRENANVCWYAVTARGVCDETIETVFRDRWIASLTLAMTRELFR
jgi:hypothetical protein